MHVQLDDELAEQVAPKAGGAQGLRTQLLKMQQEKTGRDTEQAINEALMAAVVESAQADIPHHFVAEMGRQEYQARLLAAVARVRPCPALPCPALPCPALPCPALPCPALPCPALPCPALPCPALPCPALPCPALPCPALFCPALSRQYLIVCHVTSCDCALHPLCV